MTAKNTFRNRFCRATLIALSAFALLFFIPARSEAACAQLTQPLHYGTRDITTAGQVSVLQNFLYNGGYLGVSATGYFGPLTLRAVETFQEQFHLSVDGIVGPQTRAYITNNSCEVPPPVVPSATPYISSINPSVGPTGTTVTLIGSGFTASNIVHIAGGALSTIPSSNNGTALYFTMPSSIGPYCLPTLACPMYMQLLNAGTYTIYIQNTNGNSNTVTFTVTNNSMPIPN